MPDAGIVILGSTCLLAWLFQGRGGRGLLSGGSPCQPLGTCFFQLMVVQPATPFPQGVELEDSVNPQAPEQAGMETFHLLENWEQGGESRGGSQRQGGCTCVVQITVTQTPPLSRKARLSPQPSQAPFCWKFHQAACNNLSWLFPGRSLCRPTLLLPFPTPECCFQGRLRPRQLFQDLSRSSVSYEASRLQPRVHLGWSRMFFSSRRCDTGHWGWGLVGVFFPA